jgi:hypothetical protein
MLYVELNGLKRYYVFQRIYARFNAVRARAEKKELTNLARTFIQEYTNAVKSAETEGIREEDGTLLNQQS